MTDMECQGVNATKLWIGIAVGAAIGIGYVLSRRSAQKTRWMSAKEVTERIASGSSDLADTGKQMIERIRTIYDEGRKVIDDASELWAHGRKLVRS